MSCMGAIGQCVRQLREDKGWTIQALAEKVGLTKDAQSKRERGEISIKPPLERKYASAFGMTLDEFRSHWRGQKIHDRPAPEMIPLINRVSAGRVIEYDHEQGAAAEYHDANAYIQRDKDTTGPLLFAATVVGDSMEPALHSGDVVVFDPLIPGNFTPTIKSGDVVYVRWAKGTGVYGNGVYRVFFETLPTVRLTKDNKKYPEIHTQVTKDFIDQIAVGVQLRTSWVLRGRE